VVVSGTAALNDQGRIQHPDDIYLQTQTALKKALEAAASLGAQRDNVIRTRLLLAPDTDWQQAVKAHGEIFRDRPPANTTFFVAGFIPDDVLIEVELEAFVDP
jgi:enamine deaminase RidA (YjgF/YER057c/UK114 family)